MTSTTPAFSALELRSVMAIALVFSFRMLGLFMIFPIFTIAIEQQWGDSVSAWQIGLALGIYGLTQACLQMPMGILSDRWGRKPLIVVGLLMFFAGSLLAALATNIEQLIIARALQGGGAIAAVLLAFLADLTSPQVRTRSMAIVGMGIGASFMLSLLLGPWVYSLGGLSWIFLLTAILAVVGIIMVIWLIPAKPMSASILHQIHWRDITHLFRQLNLWQLNLGVFCIHAALTCLFLFLPLLLLQQFDLNAAQHWRIYFPVMLLSLVFTVPLILLAEKHRRLRLSLQIAALLLLCTCLSLLGLIEQATEHTKSGLMIAFVLTLFFVGFNTLEAILPSLVSRLCPTRQRGTAMGMFSTCQFLGAFAGGSVGGLMLQQYGVSGVLFVVAAMLGMWFISSWIFPSVIMQSTKTLVIQPQQSVDQVERWSSQQAAVLEASYQAHDGLLVLKVISDEFQVEGFEADWYKHCQAKKRLE